MWWIDIFATWFDFSHVSAKRVQHLCGVLFLNPTTPKPLSWPFNRKGIESEVRNRTVSKLFRTQAILGEYFFYSTLIGFIKICGQLSLPTWDIAELVLCLIAAAGLDMEEYVGNYADKDGTTLESWSWLPCALRCCHGQNQVTKLGHSPLHADSFEMQRVPSPSLSLWGHYRTEYKDAAVLLDNVQCVGWCSALPIPMECKNNSNVQSSYTYI